MLGLPASSGFGANPLLLLLAQASPASYIPPALLFVLCLVAAIGVILLLPGRMEGPLRKIGAVVLLAAGLVFAALVAKTAGGMGIYFWVFAAIALLGAVRVITHPKPVYSALYFVLTVMATAGLFVLMWAEFMAAALILIYAGAILVTYVFVIMLAAEAQPEMRTDSAGAMHEQLAEHDAISREPIIASAVGVALLGILLFVIFDQSAPLNRPVGAGFRLNPAIPAECALAADNALPLVTTTQPVAAGFVPAGGTQQLGNFLFNKQLVNLELAGLILTVAMVGAIVIARKRIYMPARDTGMADSGGAGAGGETVIGPATPVDDNPHSIPVYGTMDPKQKAFPET